jgi:hypothetical protein
VCRNSEEAADFDLETQTLKKPSFRSPGWAFAAVAAAAFAVMLITCVRVWLPGYGLTRFIDIGRELNRRGTAVYRATPKYMDPYPPNRWGFDGQYYAEIALDPLLRDPQLKMAIDNPTYRSQRVLISTLAWLGGLGRPYWILNVYAALNPLFWLGYAAMLFVLFRPYGWRGVGGFAAMLLTCGIIESTSRSLTDFPAFVLMTLAAMIGGTGGAGVMALAALAREVDILGILGLAELGPPWGKALKKNLLMGLIAVVPMLLWFVYVGWRFFGHAHAATGSNVAPGLIGRSREQIASMTGGNLDWPLRAIGMRFGDAIAAIRRDGFEGMQFIKRGTEVHALLTIIATLTQCLFVLTHPVWRNRLWRIGAVFVPYFLCVSYQVWAKDSYFTATRHALPITLAFNLVLAMRPNRRWLLWFLLGNCFVPAGVYDFIRFGREVPRHAEFIVEGAPPLDATVTARYGDGWSGPEWNTRKAWRWAVKQKATLILSNPAREPLDAQLDFNTISLLPRDLSVSVAGAVVQLQLDQVPQYVPVAVKFILPPGETRVNFSTPQPAAIAGDDPRPLAFMISDLSLSVAEKPR